MLFRNDIQGLRALAFLLVFIFHLNMVWLPGGYLGVDLFLVISGYLITTITLSDIQKDKFTFLNFFKKRIKRLVPAYFILLSCISAVGAYLIFYTDIGVFAQSLKYATLFVSNLIFSSGDSYFGAKLSENPFLHTWSLSIEMQFYLLLPFILYFFRRYLKIVLSILLVGLTIYSTYNIYVLDNKSLMYFSLLARIPEFLVGSLFAIFFKQGLNIARSKANVIAVLCLAIILVCTFLYTEESHFPGYLALIPTLSLGVLLVLNNSIVSDILSNKYLVLIGKYSYSLYLWHWPIMAFIRYRYDTYDFTASQIVLVVVLTVLCSYLSFRFIESVSAKYSDKKFLLIYGTIFSLLLIFGVTVKKIKANDEIPAYYSKPYFAMDSHSTGKSEKIGDTSKNDSIALIGDSHAMMLKPFLDYIGKQNNFSINALTCDGFVAFDGINKDEIPSNKQYIYELSRNFIEPTSDIVKKNKLIIVSSIGFERYPSLKTSLEHFIKSLKSDQKLILINSFPMVTVSPLKINNGFVKKSDYEIQLITNEENKEILLDFTNKYSNVYFYDVSKSKIFETPGYVNDTVAYYDTKHINTYGSLKMAEDLNQNFSNFLNEVLSK